MYYRQSASDELDYRKSNQFPVSGLIMEAWTLIGFRGTFIISLTSSVPASECIQSQLPDPKQHERKLLASMFWSEAREEQLVWYLPYLVMSQLLIVVWNMTFVFYCIKVREDFLPILTYAQNWLQANWVGKVPLNYWSWLLIGQKLRGNMSDSKQIEWSWQDFVL